MHNKGSVTLPWMDSRWKNNGFPDRDVFRSRGKVSHDNHFAIIACNSLTEDGFPNLILGLICTKTVKELTTVTISVGVAVSQIDLVIIMLKVDLKSESVIWASSLLSNTVLEIADVLTISLPTYASFLRSLLCWVYQRFHALVITAVIFD